MYDYHTGGKGFSFFLKCFLILLSLFSPIIVAVAVAVAVGVDADALDNEVDAGVVAYNSKDYESAKKILLKAADRNSAFAQYNLGQMYRLGRGVPIDYQQAKIWYMAAAKQGHPEAQGNLGTLYYHGKLGERNYSEAYIWLLPAAMQQNAQAQWTIGAMFYNGEGVQKNIVQAFAWLTLASEQSQQAMVSKNQIEQELTMPQKQEALKFLAKLRNTPGTPDDNTPAPKTTIPVLSAPPPLF